MGERRAAQATGKRAFYERLAKIPNVAANIGFFGRKRLRTVLRFVET